ncbi:hypothetical protein ACFXGA_26970 [Actinosynnema sp. NPDC059335]|uniref:hypothetical protein n=1 Tax=Actinosynnema sp. NPDC059335 TaxID=3346804 RepID=UPI003670A168
MASSTNGSVAASNGGPSGSPANYIRGLDDTAPMDRVDDPRFDEEQGVDPRAVVKALTTRVEVAKDLARLESDEDLFRHLDPDEIDEEREVLRLERAKNRELRTWQAERDLKRGKRKIKRAQRRARREELRATVTGWVDRRFRRRDERDVASDARWHRRAQRVRARLTSTDARIAAQIRSATRWSNTLIALMFGGLLYTGFVVQKNFVPSGDKTDPLFWLSLTLEALASVALMALMRFDARAALAGITRAGSAVWQGWLVKAGLLLASLAAASGPAIKDLDLGDMVRTGWAPVLVAAVLLIHDRISRGDAQVLATLMATADEERVDHLAAVAVIAMQQGMLEPSRANKDGETAPSASQLATFFRISKPDAMAVRDKINLSAQPTG